MKLLLALSLLSLQAHSDLAVRAKKADRIVVGRVMATESAWQYNSFGDKLIVTDVTLAVEEALKGQVGQTTTIEIEGGTIDNLVMGRSDVPLLKIQDRTVVFLVGDRHQGIFKLEGDRIVGRPETLPVLRGMVGR